MGDLDAAGVAGAPIVIGLVWALGGALRLDKRWSPVLAVALGVAWAVMRALASGTIAAPGGIATALMVGVVTGLAASGLYSSTKALSGN